MTTEDKLAYYVGVHRYSYQAGIPALVLGVEVVNDVTPCFKLLHKNGVVDYAPLSDYRMYKIISGADVKANDIPPVTE